MPVVTQTPLRERHENLGAHFFERDGFALPQSYGDVNAEYDALYFGAGVIDMVNYGVLRVEGRDRVEWLHKLVTTNVPALSESSGAYGLLLNATGHIAADFVLLRQPDAFWLYTTWSAKEKLYANLRRAIFREKVTLTDVSDAFSLLSLEGALAGEYLTRALGATPPRGEFSFSAAKFFDSELLIVHNPRTPPDGFDLLVERRHLEILWDMLTARGVRPVGWSALNAARIEVGIAWYGDDFDETMLAPEARLDAYIAENKGCYTGQEVIARIKNRGHVNRLLAQFQIEGSVVPAHGDLVFADDREVGWITSAAWSFAHEAPRALGYLRREAVQEGARVQIVHGDTRLAATVFAR